MFRAIGIILWLIGLLSIQDLAAIIQTISGLLSIFVNCLSFFVAFMAVVIALLAQYYASKRFSKQLVQQEKIAVANVKPLLAIINEDKIDRKGLFLTNGGIGTAVITGIAFTNGGMVETSLAPFFNLPGNPTLDNSRDFRAPVSYLKAGDEIPLILLSETNLVNQDFDSAKIASIFTAWQQQKIGITITIRYEDIFGNPQNYLQKTWR